MNSEVQNVKTERDVLMAACGVNQQMPEQPKAQILLETKLLDFQNDSEVRVDSMELYGPIINCFRNVQHMCVDVQFDEYDLDFIQSVQMLKSFCSPEYSLDNQNGIVPVVVLTILPISLEGEYFASGVNGSWVIMPSQANRLPDTIRFIFNNQDFHTYRLNEDKLELPEEKTVRAGA